MDYAKNAQGQASAARPQTELEGSLSEIRIHLLNTIDSAREIAARVLAPTPPAPTAATVAPVAVTYHQKLRELAELADQLRGIVGELNGRI